MRSPGSPSAGASVRSRSAARRAMPIWRTSSSSKASRCRPVSASPRSRGRCTAASASRFSASPSRSRSSAGSGSGTCVASGSAASTTRRTVAAAISSAAGIDRSEVGRGARLVADVVGARLEAEAAELAAQADLRSRLQPIGEPGLVEPGDADRGRVVGDARDDPRPAPPAHRALLDVEDAAADDHLLALAERGDRDLVGGGLVPARPVLEHVPHGREPELPELPLGRRGDAGERVESRARGAAAAERAASAARSRAGPGLQRPSVDGWLSSSAAPGGREYPARTGRQSRRRRRRRPVPMAAPAATKRSAGAKTMTAKPKASGEAHVRGRSQDHVRHHADPEPGDSGEHAGEEARAVPNEERGGAAPDEQPDAGTENPGEGIPQCCGRRPFVARARVVVKERHGDCNTERRGQHGREHDSEGIGLRLIARTRRRVVRRHHGTRRARASPGRRARR